jgi:hypothetical protein
MADRTPHVMKQADSGELGERANHGRQTDKPQIMFGHNAIVYG